MDAQYYVVEFDDGVRCSAEKVMERNGKYTAKWKNTWYNVKIIAKTASKQECEELLKKDDDLNECLQDLNNEEENNFNNTDSDSEPFGSNSDSDPTFEPNHNSRKKNLQFRTDTQSPCSSDKSSTTISELENANMIEINLTNNIETDIYDIENYLKRDTELPLDSDNSSDAISELEYAEKGEINVINIQTDVHKNENWKKDLEKMKTFEVPISNGPINLVVPKSFGSKKYFCIFCKNMFVKLPLHLETKHKTEELVKQFRLLPKGSEARKKILDDIRKQGAFEFNTNQVVNTGHIIVSRRTKLNKTANDYKICPHCRGMFSRESIRKHYKKCIPSSEKGNRSLGVMGKRLEGRVHKNACSVLKDKIFPAMRDDDISNIIRYDELAIEFGNSLCCKYRLEHLFKMIRAKLRLLGRFLLTIKAIDTSINELMCVFDPEKTDSVIMSIHKIAELNSETQQYKSPATAADLGTTLKKCGKKLISVFIKRKNFSRMEDVKNFLNVFEEDLATSVSKTVSETQLLQQRRRSLALPSTNEVNKLYDFVEENMKYHYRSLKSTFSAVVWKELCSFLLIVIQIFNRKRAGEVERMFTEDFLTYQPYNNNDGNTYYRFVIRGKKARGVPVLLSRDMLDSVLLVLENRKKAGVLESNPYVFGIPSGSLTNNHLSACALMRKFSEISNVENSHLLRGTQLRKHLATESASRNLNNLQVNDLANFMGHHTDIHLGHYRLAVPVRETAEVSQLLQMGVGRQNETIGTEISSMDLDREIPSETEANQNVRGNKDSWNNSSEETSYGRQRCVSPVGTVKSRRSWENSEIEVASTVFSQNLTNKNIPTRQECLNAIMNNGCLRNRTVEQLKSWVSNQFKRKHDHLRKTERVFWSDQEKEIMSTVFQKHVKDGILPGLKMCAEILKRHPQLSQRTPTTVKAWVNNTIRKNKKN